MNYCEICYVDYGNKVYCNYEIKIIEWNKGFCYDSCSITCNVIHDEPIEKIVYVCRRHHIQLRKEEKEINLEI